MAFVQETNEFTAAYLDDNSLPMKLSNAVKAVRIGAYLQEALVSGMQIHVDEIGRRIEKAQL
jgi:myo-inositol 2-dehydrogenase/D-chiro-inositol 1-dehydrogenase